VTLVAWAGIGFHGLRDYPALLRSLSHSEATSSYSLVALADRLHVPHPHVDWLAIAVPLSLALAAACLPPLLDAISTSTARSSRLQSALRFC
jgi:hypothetical protein